jgi:histidine triad (HIT) family protein
MCSSLDDISGKGLVYVCLRILQVCIHCLKLRTLETGKLSMDCIFCRIVTGHLSANIIYKDDSILAFEDIHPQAPHHKIIIPQRHIATLNDLRSEDNELLGHMVQSASKLAQQLGFAEDGYRLVMNCNGHGGQTVFHIHLHLLGGRALKWPPG